jgi:hypothetical protein
LVTNTAITMSTETSSINNWFLHFQERTTIMLQLNIHLVFG